MLIVTVFYLFLQILGTGVLEVLIILIIIDLFLLELNRRIDKFGIIEDTKKEIDIKLSEMQKLYLSADTYENPLDGMLKKHKDDTNYVLDRFARKNIEIENNVNKVKKTVASAVASLDERIKNLEEKD